MRERARRLLAMPPAPHHHVLPRGWRRVYCPFVGWMVVGPDERERVDRYFQRPMMLLALFAVPVFAHEFLLPASALANPAVTVAIEIALAMIWLAFTVEFVIKIAIAQSRSKYILKNWLDLVIILLPFLRPLRGLAVARSLRLARLLSVFSLRGVAMKLLRTGVAAALGWGVVRRWFAAPEAEADVEARERARLEGLSRRALIEELLALKRENRRLQAALLEEEKAMPPPHDTE